MRKGLDIVVRHAQIQEELERHAFGGAVGELADAEAVSFRIMDSWKTLRERLSDRVRSELSVDEVAAAYRHLAYLEGRLIAQQGVCETARIRVAEQEAVWAAANRRLKGFRKLQDLERERMRVEMLRKEQRENDDLYRLRPVFDDQEGRA